MLSLKTLEAYIKFYSKRFFGMLRQEVLIPVLIAFCSADHYFKEIEERLKELLEKYLSLKYDLFPVYTLEELKSTYNTLKSRNPFIKVCSVSFSTLTEHVPNALAEEGYKAVIINKHIPLRPHRDSVESIIGELTKENYDVIVLGYSVMSYKMIFSIANLVQRLIPRSLRYHNNLFCALCGNFGLVTGQEKQTGKKRTFCTMCKQSL